MSMHSCGGRHVENGLIFIWAAVGGLQFVSQSWPPKHSLWLFWGLEGGYDVCLNLKNQSQAKPTNTMLHYPWCCTFSLLLVNVSQLQAVEIIRTAQENEKAGQRPTMSFSQFRDFFNSMPSRGVFLNGIIEMTLQRDQHLNVGFKKVHVTFTLIINRL